jgi:quercetin 2,3-dioxygenase
LLLPPSYARGHFDAAAGLNRITALIGDQVGAIPIAQDARVSRLLSDIPCTFRYRPRSPEHGVYAFVIDGTMRCAGAALDRRDSKAVWGVDQIICETGPGDTDILLIETIM